MSFISWVFPVTYCGWHLRTTKFNVKVTEEYIEFTEHWTPFVISPYSSKFFFSFHFLIWIFTYHVYVYVHMHVDTEWQPLSYSLGPIHIDSHRISQWPGIYRADSSGSPVSTQDLAVSMSTVLWLEVSASLLRILLMVFVCFLVLVVCLFFHLASEHWTQILELGTWAFLFPFFSWATSFSWTMSNWQSICHRHFWT